MNNNHKKVVGVIGAILFALLLFGCTQTNPNNQTNTTTTLTGDQVANTAANSTIGDTTSGTDMIDNSGTETTPQVDGVTVDTNGAGIGEMI